jgi:hypothetical protein
LITGHGQKGQKQIWKGSFFDLFDLHPVDTGRLVIMPIFTSHSTGVAADAAGLIKIES